MRAIILAAGRGTRIGLRNLPKCLLKIGGKTILAKQVEALKSIGIKDITVVCGKDEGMWSGENIRKIRRVSSKIIFNKDFMSTQSPHSLYLALKGRKPQSLLIIDGDLIFESRVLELLSDTARKSVILAQRPEGLGGSGVILKADRDFGFLLKRIGGDIISGFVYAGLMRLDKKDYRAFECKLKTKKYNNSILAKLLQDVASERKICCIKLVNRGGKKESLELGLMPGGSLSRTTKMIRKQKRKAVVRKESKVLGEDKLAAEIKWINRLPEKLQKHFPQILNFYISKEPTYFEMPYYDMPALRNLLLNGKIKAGKALKTIEKILDFMFREVYCLDNKPALESYVIERHLKRIYERLIQTYQEVGIFRDIIDAPYIQINGKKYKNIIPLTKEMSGNPGFIKWLMPPFTCKVHGDLHFDNILIGEKGNFVLVDPRGDDLDITYDMGKIWHSCHGLYDFIHMGKFHLTKKRANITYKIKSSPAILEYRKIYRALPEIILKYRQVKADSLFLTRAFFAEAAHFSSVIPFQIKNDGKEKIALACYAVGVEFLNNIYNVWLSGVKNKENIEADIVNINTIKDYERAKVVFK
ncbi:MAG: NTP transferase domain-containing protein [Candidatus Omnitrophica bacterium]|nr:NTP transferase domain-containing protein [Candidatus Omnitrophota bacterium]